MGCIEQQEQHILEINESHT